MPPIPASRPVRRASRLRRGAALLAVLAACGPLAAVHAQAPAPVTRQQQATWLGAFVDHALTARTAFWFDGQWRRDGLGAVPQQLLLRPGVQVTLAPGVRVASGYAYIATAQYGELPIANPAREHRLWQQLVLTHRGGPLSFMHRYRWEQRWTTVLRPDGSGGRGADPFRYGQRARYMLRAQGDLPGLAVGGRPVLAFLWDEVMLPVGHGEPVARFTQNRLAAGIGVRLDDRQRLELGYMHQWIGRAARRENEVNHTLTLQWFWAYAR